MVAVEPTEEQKYERAKRRVFGGTFILLALFATGIYYAVRKTAEDAAVPARVIAIEPFVNASGSRDLAVGLADLTAQPIAEGEAIRVVPMHAMLSGPKAESDFVIGGILRRHLGGWHLRVTVSDGERSQPFELEAPTLLALDQQIHSRVVKVANPSARYVPHASSEDLFTGYLEARGRVATRNPRKLDEAITKLSSGELATNVHARGLRAFALALRALSEPQPARIEAAGTEAELVVARSSENLDALEAVAIAGMLADEQWNRVYEASDLVVVRAPGRDLAHLARAVAHLHSGLLDLALIEAGMARVANPSLDLAADRVEAIVRLYRGDPVAVQALFAETAEPAAGDLILLAQAALLEKNITAASRFLRRAVTASPDTYAPQALLRALNPPNVAESTFAIEPATHHDFYAAGVLAASKGKWKDAAQWLKRAATGGFAPLAWYEHDPMLESFRRRPEFNELRRVVLEEVKRAQMLSKAVPRG